MSSNWRGSTESQTRYEHRRLPQICKAIATFTRNVGHRIVLAERKLLRFRNTKGEWLCRLCHKLSSLPTGGGQGRTLIFSIYPYSWSQLLLRPMMLVPAQPVPSPLFSSMFPSGVLVSLFPLGAQVNVTCGFRFGAIPITWPIYPLPSPASYLCTDLFDPRSSPCFIVEHTYEPMDFQDPPEACVKKGVKPFYICFCHSPCLASIQQDSNDIWLEDPHLSFSAEFICSPHFSKSMKNTSSFT